ncbi:MAG: glutamyl-tRNA reductase [Lachnospiraceae bacterium]|nr:glutamyl-tRNA reductase [Lachnospiraceae bacterium]
MAIEMTGIDHSAAGIDIRMIFSFTKKSTQEFYTYIKEMPGVEGCVLLSTCIRTELWVSTSADQGGDLYEVLCRFRGVDPECYRDYFSFRREREAVRHLFRLAGGLRSRILGEDQILSQVGDALAFSRENYAADHVLETLFRQAVTAGKKIKTGVTLSSADPSVVHVMIRELSQNGMSFSGKKCMVIGNGAMGKLAAVLLREQGADVTMTVRQYHSGLVDIPADCARIDYGRRMELFPRCDYVVSATASPYYTLPFHLVEQAVRKPVVLVDLAVPRDIDPAAGALPDVTLFDVDSFRKEAQSEEQRLAIREAEEILTEQMEQFFVWYDCVDVIPLIQTLKQEMAGDLCPRLSGTLRGLPLKDSERQQLEREIEAAAQRAANRLLFGLRDDLDPQTFRECLSGIRKVYR